MTRPRVKNKTIHPSLHLTDTVSIIIIIAVYWAGLHGRTSSTYSAVYLRPPFNIFHGPSSKSVHEMDVLFCLPTTSVRLWEMSMVRRPQPSKRWTVHLSGRSYPWNVMVRRPNLSMTVHLPPLENCHGRLSEFVHWSTVDRPPQNYYLGPPSESGHEVNGMGPMPWDKMTVRRPNGSSSVEA